MGPFFIVPVLFDTIRDKWLHELILFFYNQILTE